MNAQDQPPLLAVDGPVAEFSPCLRWRYTLWRRWKPGPFVQFIGLNPSTADEWKDDPTVRRCIAFAKSWGLSAMCMTNLFGWRDTLPARMKAVADPEGPDNDRHLKAVAGKAGMIIAAWGTHGSHRDRGLHVTQLLGIEIIDDKAFCLGRNMDGSPKHPLYVAANVQLLQFEG